jgi:hypothetical protein
MKKKYVGIVLASVFVLSLFVLSGLNVISVVATSSAGEECTYDWECDYYPGECDGQFAITGECSEGVCTSGMEDCCYSGGYCVEFYLHGAGCYECDEDSHCGGGEVCTVGKYCAECDTHTDCGDPYCADEMTYVLPLCGSSDECIGPYYKNCVDDGYDYCNEAISYCDYY